MKRTQKSYYMAENMVNEVLRRRSKTGKGGYNQSRVLEAMLARYLEIVEKMMPQLTEKELEAIAAVVPEPMEPIQPWAIGSIESALPKSEQKLAGKLAKMSVAEKIAIIDEIEVRRAI
jgi:hypothetical protein